MSDKTPGDVPLAAVVILHRQDRGRRQILWVKRSETLAFLGGFWAFPGGRLEPQDAKIAVPGVSSGRAAHIAAAARELGEETGVRVAPSAQRFIFAGRSVSPDWVPPTVRFDASYFLVEAPLDAAADHTCSQGELSACEWTTPDEVLAAWQSGNRLISTVVLGVMRAIKATAERLPDARAIETELVAESSARSFPVCAGVEVCMLRTPTLPPATHTNCYLIGGKDLIVVDPASPYPEEQAALDQVIDDHAHRGRHVREIWLTHHHWDHVSGVSHLAKRLNVPVAAHKKTASLLAGHIEVSRNLDDGHVEVIAGTDEIPERRLRCLFTPGHAPGHHCFYEEQSECLITGDMMAGIGTILIDPSEGDMTVYLDSLRRMKTLPTRLLLPAHGPMMANAHGRIDEYIAHRLWRERLVMDALSACGTASVGDLIASVYDDVPKQALPFAERSLLAHLLKLSADGRARQNEDSSFTALQM